MDQIYFCCLNYRCTLTTRACKMRQLKMNDEICLSCGKVVVSKKKYPFLKPDKAKFVKVRRCRNLNDIQVVVDKLLVGQCIEIPANRNKIKQQQNTIHNRGRRLKRSFKTSTIDNRMTITRMK